MTQGKQTFSWGTIHNEALNYATLEKKNFLSTFIFFLEFYEEQNYPILSSKRVHLSNIQHYN